MMLAHTGIEATCGYLEMTATVASVINDLDRAETGSIARVKLNRMLRAEQLAYSRQPSMEGTPARQVWYLDKRDKQDVAALHGSMPFTSVTEAKLEAIKRFSRRFGCANGNGTSLPRGAVLAALDASCDMQIGV